MMERRRLDDVETMWIDGVKYLAVDSPAADAEVHEKVFKPVTLLREEWRDRLFKPCPAALYWELVEMGALDLRDIQWAMFQHLSLTPNIGLRSLVRLAQLAGLPDPGQKHPDHVVRVIRSHLFGTRKSPR
jgi:hypothetical protein